MPHTVSPKDLALAIEELAGHCQENMQLSGASTLLANTETMGPLVEELWEMLYESEEAGDPKDQSIPQYSSSCIAVARLIVVLFAYAKESNFPINSAIFAVLFKIDGDELQPINSNRTLN